MSLQVTVVNRPPDAEQFWAAMGRVVPRSLGGTAAKMAATAPHGKSGKLGRRVDIIARRVNQGLIQGIEVLFGVGVRYGHLVAGGHRIIARGAASGHGQVIGQKTVIRNRLRGGAVASEKVIVPVRETRRAALLRRRGEGAIGFVPGNPWAVAVFQEDQPGNVQLIERGLAQDVHAL